MGAGGAAGRGRDAAASPGRRREDDRWAVVGGALVAATALVGVFSLLDYRVAGVDAAHLSTGSVAAVLCLLPVAALVAVGLSVDREPGVDPLTAGVRAGFAAGLYAAVVALLFLSLANARVLLAAAGTPGPLFADLLANGVLLLLSFPAATVAGLAVGYPVALPLARS